MNHMLKHFKIEVPEPPLAESGSYCQFCYSAENLTPILPASNDSQRHIVALLDTLINVKLNMEKPSAICKLCITKISEFDYFRSKCSIYSNAIEQSHYNEYQNASSEYIKSESVLETFERSNVIEQKEPNNDVVDIPKKDSVRVSNTKPSSNNKPQFIKTGRTGPLMRKLNKLRGIKSNTSKKIVSEHIDYRCRICLQFFIDKDSMSFHLRNHIDSHNVRCMNCSKTFYTLQGLMAHAMRSYILTTFSCQHCDVLFKTKEELFAHELYCEQDKSKYQTVDIAKAYQCSKCPKSYDSHLRLQAHLPLHDVKIVCDKCGTDFSSEKKLKNHNERYHSKGADKIASVVKCELCHRTFVDASAYRSHLTGLHQIKDDHLSRKLDEDRLYECDHCDKRFWSINTIRYHVLVHRHYRDCDQCSESYRSRQELRDHKLAAHPVQCPFCPKTFFSKTSCRSHASKKHGMVQIKLLATDGNVTYEWRRLVFKCASCEQDYEYFRELSDHNKKMHPGVKIQIKCCFCERHISSSRIGYLGHVTGNCGQTPKKVKAWH
ncbi:hypothetical protein RP20_CCG014165 [Aedes albopictus]|nr:hypothetical protein RP20_CCG014165 [Aedes albopictus]